MSASFPGFDAPAVGFEQPFEMLEACHERVRRSLTLLVRLVTHIDANGHDAQSRSAAADVLRYFDLAAPLHHEDEERHVFPVLVADQDVDMVATIAGLRRDHARMAALWSGLRDVLLVWAGPAPVGGVTAESRRQAEAFEAVYATHLQTEEGVVFPAARARMDSAQLAAMSADMALRRKAPTAA